MSAEGAAEPWELPALFASGYESPLIYRDHLWISRIHPKNASLSGSYEGTYALRTPTEGRVTGTFLVEP